MSSVLRNSWLAPMFLALVLATGMLTAWIFAGFWCVTLLEGVWRTDYTREDVVITRDGEALIRTTTGLNPPVISYRSLEGQPAEVLDSQILNTPAYLYQIESPDDESRRSPLPWSNRVHSYSDGLLQETRWYLVYEAEQDSAAWLEGYDARTRRRVGYLGASGFATRLSDVEPFELGRHRRLHGGSVVATGTSYFDAKTGNASLVFLVENGKLWKVNLTQRTVTRIPCDEAVVSIGPNLPMGDKQQGILVRFNDRMALIDFTGEVQFSLALPAEVGNDFVYVYRYFGEEPPILHTQRFLPEYAHQVFWYDAEGKVARHETLSMLEFPHGSSRLAAWGLAALVPSPATYAAFFAWVYHQQESALPTQRVTPAIVAPPLTALIAISTLLAAWVYRRHRRLSEHGAIAWALLVLALGLPGFAGYWLHRHWPATSRCQSCGDVTPRDRLECLFCHAEFPAPQARGIEIFA